MKKYIMSLPLFFMSLFVALAGFAQEKKGSRHYDWNGKE